MKRLALYLAACLAVLFPLAARGDGLWNSYPSRGYTHFYQTYRSGHAWCGQPTSRERNGPQGYRQYFQHCTMKEAPVTVIDLRVPTAAPTTVPSATPLPTIPPPPTNTPTPTSTSLPPPPPTDTPVPTNPVLRLLAIINNERTDQHVPPLALDPTLSNGDGQCPGALGHAAAMALTGTIWHQNDQYPNESFPNDICGWGTRYFQIAQNVGVAAGQDELGNIDTVNANMMAEPWSPGCTENHHCNLLNPTYTRVGLAVVDAPFHRLPGVYIVENFAGP